MADDERSALEEDRLTSARLAKVEAMRAAGDDPYPVRFERTHTTAAVRERWADLAAATATGERVTVAGRLINTRRVGGLAFGVLRDHTGDIQLFVESASLGERFDAFDSLDGGDWVGATGEVITTKRGELSVRVESFALLAKGLRPLPDKWHGLQDVEKRHRQRYVDLIVNEEARTTMLQRIAVVQSIRQSLLARDFLEVETPVLHAVPSGGLATPFVTHHDALDQDMYLRIALELHLKRLIVGGIDRVFEIGRVFRNEGVSTRHNPEFTMLEVYQALADYYDMIDLTEALVTEAAREVRGTTEIEYDGRPMSLQAPWSRVDYVGGVAAATGKDWDPVMPVADAAQLARGAGVKVEPSWGTGRIIAETFEALVEPTLWEPTVVMDFPEEISPLARKHRSRPGLTERFEVIVAGKELANAFSELNDPVDQRRRFETQAAARESGDHEAHPMDEDFLRALEYGMPPTGGMGMGIDRLVMLLTDHASIREVLLFPHLRSEGSEM
ncbi:MAG TPA: lysine--tRNA ligase [Acidimicrobiia bacterium]|nr:lysine--tRNA ligase [Acidimicrobiia bacterium]